jgi:predicted nucleic acid-binding protein
MPNKSVPRYYWDSCVFLSYIEGTPDRVHDIETLLNEAANGTIEIYTSMISIAEVAFAKQEKDGRTLDSATEAAIEALWVSPSPIKLVEYYRLIANQARRLVRESMEQSLGLKPFDAIHLATAQRLQVDAVHTYDGPMQRNAVLVGIPVVPPEPVQPMLPLPRTPRATEVADGT